MPCRICRIVSRFLGFGANGTIYSVIASQIVPILLKGRLDKGVDIFRFRQ